MIIKNIDKYYHLGAGFIIALLFGLINPYLTSMAMVIGYYKEYKDKQDPLRHTYDGWDAFATSVGIIPAQVCLVVATYFGWWSFLLVF